MKVMQLFKTMSIVAFVSSGIISAANNHNAAPTPPALPRWHQILLQQLQNQREMREFILAHAETQRHAQNITQTGGAVVASGVAFFLALGSVRSPQASRVVSTTLESAMALAPGPIRFLWQALNGLRGISTTLSLIPNNPILFGPLCVVGGVAATCGVGAIIYHFCHEDDKNKTK